MLCPHATDALITAGDTWLSQTVPTLLGQGAVVVVVFDEATGGDKTHGGGHVFALETGDGVAAGATDGTFYSHNSLLAGLENDLQVRPLLGAASTATPLPIPNGITTPAPTVTGFTPGSGASGRQHHDRRNEPHGDVLRRVQRGAGGVLGRGRLNPHGHRPGHGNDRAAHGDDTRWIRYLEHGIHRRTVRPRRRRSSNTR